jgi:hypothetical protein
MIRRGYFLCCLFLASLMTTGAVHAQESPSVPTLECSGAVHSEGDADQSSGDSDKNISHHHSGCHGFAACARVSDQSPLSLILVSKPTTLSDTPPMARSATGPQLRPPIA